MPACVRKHTVVQPSDPTVRLIPLTQRQNAIVDASDYQCLSQWNWHAHWNEHTRTFYARRRIWKNKVHVGFIYMHRQILDAAKYLLVDHVSHDTLDNRRNNLRLATSAQNSRNRKNRLDNSSGYRGVIWRPDARKWQARIGISTSKGAYKRYHLGYFSTREDAAAAYNEAATRLYGEFAGPNHIPQKR